MVMGQSSQENEPALGNMQRELESQLDAHSERFNKVLQAAKEQAAGAGESDLRRLKRQFASLKNTYMLYDTKEHFLDGLLADLPDGSEERKLQHWEQHTQEAMLELIAQTAEDARAVVEDGAAVQALLCDIAAREAAAEAESAGQDARPPLEEGPSEEGCRAQLARAADATREMEARIAGDKAEAAALEAAIKSEQEQLQLLRSQVEQLQADARASSGGAGDQQAAAVAARRWGAQLEWVREVTALVGALSGVGIASIDEDAVTLTLTTHAEAGDAAAGAEPREHTLRLALQPGSVALAGAELSPADVDVADIVAAAADSARPLAFVVREVHARLDAALCKASAAGAKDA